MADRPLFFFGAMSPYSWFAAERIGALLPEAEWRPVFAGGLFKANGRTSWGLTDERATKLADCEARAAEHGLGPIVWPDPWPTLDVHVSRATIHAQRAGRLEDYALAAMRLSFKEGRDLGEEGVVIEAGERVGIDVAPALQDPEIKQALRDATDDAVRRGVIGVPTIQIQDELYWGDDRLDEAVARRG